VSTVAAVSSPDPLAGCAADTTSSGSTAFPEHAALVKIRIAASVKTIILFIFCISSNMSVFKPSAVKV
jgi:hypothetical protein